MEEEPACGGRAVTGALGEGAALEVDPFQELDAYLEDEEAAANCGFLSGATQPPLEDHEVAMPPEDDEVWLAMQPGRTLHF